MFEVGMDHDELFVSAFNHAAIGMALVGPDGGILKVNESLCQFLGYSEEELSAFTFREITHPDDVKKNVDFLFELLAGKRESYEMEKRYIHKQGQIVWGLLTVSLVCDEHREPLYLISQVQDITERKHAEEAEVKRKERYRYIVEQSPDAVLIFKKGKCAYINETGVKFLAASNKEEIIGTVPYDFVEPSHHERLKHRIRKAEKGEAVDNMEEQIINLDGTPIDVEIKTLPTVYENEAATHVIIRDIRKRKKTEKFLLNSEKLTVAGQLAAGIAHEVRNPLTAVKGFFQLMENEMKERKKYFDVIYSEINRIEIILSELLVLAKPQETKFIEVLPEELLSHVVTLIETQSIMNNIEIETDIGREIPNILCDENQVKQVFINFLKNAIEAMPQGGRIVIEVCRKEEHQIVIRFIDNGSGIPEHILKKIGQPFNTSKEKGTGLGLMICYQIIENHNGKIDINSGADGTTIEVTLPAAV